MAHPHRPPVWLPFLVLILIPIPSPAHAAPAWEDRTHNLRDTRFTTVAVDPHDSARVYAGSARAVYRTADHGRHWTEALRLHGDATAVRQLVIDPTNTRLVYAATDQGLYASVDDGRHWNRLFLGADSVERVCRVLWLSAAQPMELWLGTEGGLFRSADGGASWQREGSMLHRRAIIDIAAHPDEPRTRYVLADAGCYKTTDDGQTWERLLVQAVVESDDPDDLNDLIDEATADDDPDAPPLSPHMLTSIDIDPKAPEHLYVGSQHGLYVSEDGGQTWQRAPATGLLADQIEDVLVVRASPPAVYTATPQGIFRYDPVRHSWQSLNEGLTARRAQTLAFHPADRTLWTAVTGGLFTLDLAHEPAPLATGLLADDVLGIFAHEPAIRQVQEVAIRYAEVHPGKIARWRRQAAMQALLPTVSFGTKYDRSTDTHYDEGTYPHFQVVPVYSHGFNWDVGVSWSLGKLLWNGDQTSIDTRSRLTTQLREEMLDQINRFYYERRRVQSALALEPAADMRGSVEQALRLQELTAQIDALTGGWFSQELERSK